MHKRPNRLQTALIAGATGLASLLPSAGCTSFQPTRDEHNRIVGFHQEFDAEETLSMIKIIAKGASMAYSLGGFANATGELARAAHMAKYASTVASLAKKTENQAAAYFEFEGEPHGFRELETKVTEAIENPERFIEYLGLDITQPMPEEVKRLQQIAGKWEGELEIQSNTGVELKGKIKTENVLIENGWLITGKPKKANERKETDGAITTYAQSITGWSPRDNLYHTLTTGQSLYEGRVITSFGEGTERYDPETNTWYSEKIGISSNNFFSKSTSITKRQGNVVVTESQSNFSKGKSTLRKIE